MPRRKPASSKQRKAELQLKRAIKRGDAPAPPPQPKPPRAGKRRTPPPPLGAAVQPPEPSSKRLQSAFLKVEPAFLESSRRGAATAPLPRPLPAGAAVLDGAAVGLRGADEGGVLTCPKRPKWRFDMAKKEVERNEEGMFQTWLDEVDGHVDAWRRRGASAVDAPEASSQSPPGPPRAADGAESAPPATPALRSPTYYERNLEVWRQLWRVAEISQIILLLLDSRCPALHVPPSLHAFLAALRPAHPVILVLTKSDLVPASHSAAWSAWLRRRYPSARVVKVDSYRAPDEHQAERKGQGQRKRFDPEIKHDDLSELVGALKAAHAELLTPPEKVRDDAARLAKWRPNVRQSVDWAAALRGGRRSQVDPPADDSGGEYITIGLVGQPNVGKSSLLNAIFGTHKVKASRTPGKTKHFQTLFWTPDIRLVDCPGLVMPNYVRMELQVLCGILPISQIPSIPACIHYASRLLPLERILHLAHPSVTDELPEDKRTWRGERPSLPQHAGAPSRPWTAMDILTAHAATRGWVTAKAGRPDTNRAGNTLLRALAEGKIRWAFWPPGVHPPDDFVARCQGNGIWLGDEVKNDSDGEGDVSDAESSEHETTEESASQDEEASSSEESTAGTHANTVGVGRFGALILEEEQGESEDEGSDPEEPHSGK